MKLPKYKRLTPPKIKISQTAANMLVELYYEMITVAKSAGEIDFDQDNCDTCVIGNGVRAGLLNPNSVPEEAFDSDFSRAIRSIGLPEVLKTEDETFDDGVTDFLFGGLDCVHGMSDNIQLVVGRYSNNHEDGDAEWDLDELDACVRIAGVLDRAGYDVACLPELPKGK